MLLISPAHVIIIIKASSIYSVGECSYHNIPESHIREMLLTRLTRLYTLNSTMLNLTYPNGYDVWRIARNLSCYSRWSRERRGSEIFSVQFVDRIIRVLEVCHVSTHFVKIALFQHGQNLTRKRIYVGQQNVQFVTMTYWRQIQTSHWKTGCDPFLATIYWKRF